MHHALVAVTGADGAVVLERGDAAAPVFPRSSNKPFQLLAMVRAGLDLPDDLMALGSASHSGEDFHLEGAKRILATVGLDESALQNTPDLPLDEQSRAEWLAAGRRATSLAQNCSGKHAAMLATCAVNGWDLTTYRDPQHPLQQAMAAAIEDVCGEKVAAVATDGCGAPVMAISSAGLARGFGRMAAAQDGPEKRIADAIRRHPEFLAGTRRDVTTLIKGVPGAIAKDGAEAVYAVGLPDGRGISVKITDGGGRARAVVLAAVLRSIGVESPALEELEKAPVLGHGQPVGSVTAVGF